ncbi:MAG: NYN domain-containing protein [Planctomycetaceae bacterium]|nr:MAG: NYN domain-containing protein [Planctomycetaceae bacterium]
MAQDMQQPRIGVLIDADNAQSAVIGPVLTEIAKYGITSVKRAYGDWTTQRLRSWKEVLNEHAIQPIQQFAYTSGKNATDSAMIIDAMDLLYSERLQAFCLVSSDSDFTRLATRLRESGMTVYGVGEQKTPRAFVSACDRFIYSEILTDDSDSDGAEEGSGSERAKPVPKKSTKELRQDTRLVQLLRNAASSAADDDGWANLSVVGTYIANLSADFDPRNYGYAKLSLLINATQLFETLERKTDSGGKIKYIRDNRIKKPQK